MPEHRIRLNRAWEIRAVPLDLPATALPDEAAAPTDERFDLPLLVDAERELCLLITRWFNGPANLHPGQQVEILIEPAALPNSIWFNGEPISPSSPNDGPLRLPIASRLQPHNRLDILVADVQLLASAAVLLVIHGE